MGDITITKAETGSALTPAEDLFATKDGALVGADHPDANELIARAGTPIPPHVAEHFGIEASGRKMKAPEAKAEAPKAEGSKVLTRESIKREEQH